MFLFVLQLSCLTHMYSWHKLKCDHFQVKCIYRADLKTTGSDQNALKTWKVRLQIKNKTDTVLILLK